MAGDFIVVQHATARKPEVLRIATELGINRMHAFGLCVAAWQWFDEQTADGQINGATLEMLDCYIGATGFAQSMCNVGWLRATDGALIIPNFDRMMSESAKKRSLNTRRQQEIRSAKAVAPVSRKRHKKARLQNRTEQNKNTDNASALSCPEPSEAEAAGQPADVMFTFPVVAPPGRPLGWRLTASKLAEYAVTYPGIDAESEARKALQWCVDNPTNRKTAGGMPKFLNSWMGRAQNDATQQRGRTGTPRTVSHGGGATPVDREADRMQRQFEECAKFVNAGEGPAGEPGQLRAVDSVSGRIEAHGEPGQRPANGMAQGPGNVPHRNH